MGFLKKLFNKIKGSPSDGAFPIQIEIVPNQLLVTVTEHQIPITMGNSSTSALSFVTKGLHKVGQKELFLVLKTNKIDASDIPQDPLFFFAQVYQFAQQGQYVREHDITQFGQKDMWGWKGIVYAIPPLHLQKALPTDCLCMVLLSLEEVQAVQDFGALRILSMLGKQARYYPYPYWTDHHRANLFIRALKNSLLSNVNRINLPEAVVTLIKNEDIYLKIPKALTLNIPKDSFPSSIPIGILPTLAPEADACLTWAFDSDAPEAITLPDSKGLVLGGCMLVLIGEQTQNSSRILEDGFALLLTRTEWERFWLAFRNKTTYQLETNPEAMNFSLIWE